MCFSKPSVPEVKAVAPAPTAVTSSDMTTDSARKAANDARRRSGFNSTIVSGSTAALTQQATDGMKKTLG